MWDHPHNRASEFAQNFRNCTHIISNFGHWDLSSGLKHIPSE